MYLAEEQIIKFQKLYKEQFGIEIDRKAAYSKGASLLRLVQMIYKPMTENEYQILQDRRRETGDIK